MSIAVSKAPFNIKSFGTSDVNPLFIVFIHNIKIIFKSFKQISLFFLWNIQSLQLHRFLLILVFRLFGDRYSCYSWLLLL